MLRNLDKESAIFSHAPALRTASFFLTLVGVALCALLLVVSPALAAFPGNNGDIVASVIDNGVIDNGRCEIARISLDGTEVNLTGNVPGSCKSAPSVSPDGRKVAFAVSDSENYFNTEKTDVWVMNSDGSNPTQITSMPGRDSEPDWSPDGQRLVFVSNRDGANGLYIVSAYGGPATRIATHGPVTNIDRQINYPAWSTRDVIAFSAGTLQPPGDDYMGTNYYNQGLYAINPDGTNEHELASRAHPLDSGSNTRADWAPDGGNLIYQYDAMTGTDVFTLGGEFRTDYPGLDYGYSPAWSPDGTLVAFVEARDDAQYGGRRSRLVTTAPVMGSTVREIPSPQHYAYGEIDWAVAPKIKPRPRIRPVKRKIGRVPFVQFDAVSADMPAEGEPVVAVPSGGPLAPVDQWDYPVLTQAPQSVQAVPHATVTRTSTGGTGFWWQG